jgi:succinyl-CoA synthetase beta subunit
VKLLEYQSKALLSEFGLEFTRPQVVEHPQAVGDVMASVGLPAVLKAQVPSGGRGKAGGIKKVDTAGEALDAVTALLSMEVRGHPVSCVAVEPWIEVVRELYVGITWDLAAGQPVALLGTGGGMEVEEDFAAQSARCLVDPFVGLHPYQGRELAARIGLSGRVLTGVGNVLEKLARAFVELDAMTLEINPLALQEDEQLIGLDARVEIDDDAAFRQRARLQELGEIASSAAGRPATPMEIEAERIDAMDHRGVAGRLVEFDGPLGLLIGGGGASLTVFDAVLRHGGQPANYCEMGGNPTAEKVAALTRLLLAKPGVEKLAVIMNVVNNTRADIIAAGVVAGIEAAGLRASEVVAVFRVPGSWEAEARQKMATVGVEALGREVSLDQAARLAVQRTGSDAA